MDIVFIKRNLNRVRFPRVNIVKLDTSDLLNFLCFVKLDTSDLLNFLCFVKLNTSDLLNFLCFVKLDTSDLLNFLCFVKLDTSDLLNFLCFVKLDTSDLLNFLCLWKINHISRAPPVIPYEYAFHTSILKFLGFLDQTEACRAKWLHVSNIGFLASNFFKRSAFNFLTKAPVADICGSQNRICLHVFV